jgi:hypothetical protein
MKVYMVACCIKRLNRERTNKSEKKKKIFKWNGDSE